MAYSRAFAAVLMLASAAGAQDMVEHAAGTAKATSAAGMQGVGKGAASVLDKAVKALDASATPSSSKVEAVVLPAAPGKPEPAVKLIAPDPALITPGMAQEELLRKFGQPAMKTSGTADSDAGETWWYGSGADTVTVTLAGGKVRTVSPSARPTPAPRKPDTEVTVLP
ncbi:MAG TPA: hypothetical protein VN893_12400 [Bryobacteraceae bacterium]|jgi:hypothetical protein|nr:hypothetical protein [Bryobacteraceae bacterium]